MSKSRVVSSTLTYMLAAIFAVAAVAKLRDLTGLYQVLEISLHVPNGFLWPLGQGVIAIEILIALALSISYYRMHGLVGSTVMSSAFLAFSIYRYVKDQTNPCHCFGDLVHLTPLESCLLCATMLVTSGYLIVKTRQDLKGITPEGSNLSFVLGVGCLLVCATAVGFVRRQPRVSPLTLLTIPAQTVLDGASDFNGSSHKYTVVMFGDYQCPPCKAASRQIASLLATNPGLFRVAFRNFPLANIHPFAQEAAIVAEQARLQGEFWPVHDALYSSQDLNEDQINRVRLKYHLKSRGDEGKARVSSDVLLAKKLGLDSTPSFILVDDHSACWKAKDLSSLLGHLK